MAHLLTELVALGRNSKTGGANERAEFLAARLKRSGFDVELDRVPLGGAARGAGGRNLVAMRALPGAPTVFLYGHLDTVGIADGWRTDPYSLTEKEGRIYGLGAFDMLGGISAFTEALERRTGYGVIFLGACDEEIGSAGMEGFLRKRKGLLSQADIVLSGDATDIFRRNADAGRRASSVMVGNPGYACVEAVIRPASAGRNPLEILDSVLKALRKSIDALIPGDARGPARDRAALCDIRTDMPDGATFPKMVAVDIDVYLGREATLERLEGTRSALERRMLGDARVREILGRGFSLKLGFNPEPIPPTEGFLSSGMSSPLMRSFERAVRDVTGAGRVKHVVGKYIGDENMLASALRGAGRDVPLLGYAAAGGNAHGADEYVCSLSLGQVREVCMRFLAG